MDKEERVKLKRYVIHKDGVPAVMMGTSKHQPFSKEALDEAVAKTINFAVNLRKEWDDDDIFPYGNVFFTVDSDSEILKFIKKHGKGDNDSGYKYKKLTGHKRLAGAGWNISLNLPVRKDISLNLPVRKDEIMGCMKYHQRVYEKFQEELAFLEVKARVETCLD
jgi:hypothetical protein